MKLKAFANKKSKCDQMTGLNFCFLNPFPNKPWFLCVCSTCLLKTPRNEQFLLFPQCFFYPFGELSNVFIEFKIVVCKIFQFGRV